MFDYSLIIHHSLPVKSLYILWILMISVCSNVLHSKYIYQNVEKSNVNGEVVLDSIDGLK